MMRILSSFAVSTVGLISLFVLYSSSTDHDEVMGEDPAMVEDRLPQVIKSVKLDKTYSFAGEALPKDNFDALERLDRELLVNSYWHSSTILNIKNAERYFPIIEPILSEEGVPDDFKYIAVIESNLRNVTSPAGAKGLWQFMRVSAQGYGLEVNGEVDERYHVEKSTRAACQLIKDYHKRFGSWTNAAGAYNMGETRFAKEMTRQKMENYYDMNFGQETGRYMFRILAMKEIMERPNDFGFYIEKLDPLYKPLTDYKNIIVDKSIPNLGEYAKDHNVSYRMLKVYNPWLISSSLTVSKGNSYDIKIKTS